MKNYKQCIFSQATNCTLLNGKAAMKILNKTALASYRVLERVEAGIVLTGAEVKAVRAHHVDLAGSYVKIIGSEAYLVNAKIYPYEYARVEGYDESRTRKLLLHKKEIIALKSRMVQGNFILVPISLYESNGFIKLQLALSRGRKRHEKKRDLKVKDLKREAEYELKSMRKV